MGWKDSCLAACIVNGDGPSGNANGTETDAHPKDFSCAICALDELVTENDACRRVIS